MNDTESLWKALDEGNATHVLELLREVEERTVDHWICESMAWSDLGDLERARDALTEAGRQLDDPLDMDYLWADAELCLREWRLDEGREIFERIQGVEENAAVLDRLAFCCELEGDLGRADALLGRAAALDPEGHPVPPRLSGEEMDRLVHDAAERLPAPFQASLERASIHVAPTPTADLAAAHPAETPPDALGLFVGPSELDSVGVEGPEIPPVVYVFQRNIERASLDRDDLVEQVRITLYHEIGHLLGFDEEGVEAMGLE